MKPTIYGLLNAKRKDVDKVFNHLNIKDRRYDFDVLQYNMNNDTYMYSDTEMDYLHEYSYEIHRYLADTFPTKGIKKKEIIKSIKALGFDYKMEGRYVAVITSKYTSKTYEFDKWNTLIKTHDSIYQDKIINDLDIELVTRKQLRC